MNVVSQKIELRLSNPLYYVVKWYVLQKSLYGNTITSLIVVITRYTEKKSIPMTALWCPAFSYHG